VAGKGLTPSSSFFFGEYYRAILITEKKKTPQKKRSPKIIMAWQRRNVIVRDDAVTPASQLTLRQSLVPCALGELFSYVKLKYVYESTGVKSFGTGASKGTLEV
jgi:hypothetical protein